MQRKKEPIDLATLRALLICKEKIKKTANIDEIIFYIKFMYLAHNEESRTFTDDILNKEPFFKQWPKH